MNTVDPFPSRLEPIINRALEISSAPLLEVFGSSSRVALASAFAAFKTPLLKKSAHLVIVDSLKNGQKFIDDLSFFDPQMKALLLPHFDVSPWSTLYVNRQLISARLGWLHRFQFANPGEIFVAPLEALLQKTLPTDSLLEHTYQYRKESEIPADFLKLLTSMGYLSSPLVEEFGQFSMRGGIIDLFSPAHNFPVRIELFGNFIESIRYFDPDTQRSTDSCEFFSLIPCLETLYLEHNFEHLLSSYRSDLENRQVDPADSDGILRSLTHKLYFPGSEFLLEFFYKKTSLPLDFINDKTFIWQLDTIDLQRVADDLAAQIKKDFADSSKHPLRPSIDGLMGQYENLFSSVNNRRISFSKIEIIDRSSDTAEHHSLEYKTYPTQEFSNLLKTFPQGSAGWLAAIDKKLDEWKASNHSVFIAARNINQCERIRLLLEKVNWQTKLVSEEDYSWSEWLSDQFSNDRLIHIIPRELSESCRFKEEALVFLQDEDFLGKKLAHYHKKSQETFHDEAQRLSFGDLNPGDCVVHVQHGIGVYDGLKVMPINGVDQELIQIRYKDNDRLYVPIYRIAQLQKYSGPSQTQVLDKLGGTGWDKTKTKVKKHLRDLAAELLELYARRSQITRQPFSDISEDYLSFESAFPYDETDDQLKSIFDLNRDMNRPEPMDRLICGDVGFGKTEVAMRAAFRAVRDHKQVAVLTPTTVLSFQHLETFKNRFKDWPITIHSINRFVPPAEQKKIIADLKENKIDIIIGTHRLLSKDIVINNLGLLIIDEEQKFGVSHKERIKKIKLGVDTITLSATPIPRTLNMSLMGVRDLSIITTAPIDRLPTRTFICKFDPETIRKSILSEIERGGQVFFIHNRVQSIYGIADEIRQLVPEVRIGVAHGQMEEGELEKTMISFYKGEIDVLVCTTIVESGVDIPRANTMFIDNAHTFGLSQLYQLRGRIGRSKQRAYCYLIIPHNKPLDNDAQERLKVIHDNTALGSGIRIAQYDLELRGAGNILGEEQSGHINSVGYELYMDLLQEALCEAKGEPFNDNELEPEINLRIPALIPADYIPDIRIRLSYYKVLSNIRAEEDLDKIEDDFRDQFGKLPEPVLNLMGVMLIRSYCKKLGIKDLSSGVSTISLSFTDKTPLPATKVVELAMRANKKFSITPDNRLIIRMNSITWPNIYEELKELLKQVPHEKRAN